MDSANGLPFREILILSQYYWPEPGAAQIRLRSVAAELRRLGINVRVITGMPNYPTGRIFSGYRGRLRCVEELDGTRLERIWLYPAAGRSPLKRILNYLSFTVAVLPALLCGAKPDLVFVEAQPLTLALPALLLRALRGVPYVYNAPDLQVEIAAEDRWIASNWLLRGARAAERLLARHALSVCTVSRAFIDYFAERQRVPREKISFLPNGADIVALRPLPPDRAYAENLGVGNRVVFTYAGTHAHYHGLTVILEAAKLLEDREDIVILMVGHGPVRQELEQTARVGGLRNVLFRDSSFDEMARLMSITYASLAVLRKIPTARRMRLAKAIPSLACGVPVVYAGDGETADLIQKEGCGLAIEPESPERLAAAMRVLAENPSLRAQMGTRGRHLVERDLSWNFLVSDWMRQISRINAGREPRLPAGYPSNSLGDRTGS